MTELLEHLSRSGVTVPSAAVLALAAMQSGQTDGVSCWLFESVERRTGSAIEGRGLFALDDLPAGRLVAIKQGHVVDEATIYAKADIIRGSHQQIAENQFLAGLTVDEVNKNLVGYNHSCDPNVRIIIVVSHPLAFVVTRRAVKAGNELAVDYATAFLSATQAFQPCGCGAPDCRQTVDPVTDWQIPELQQRYRGEFAYFIQEKIDQLAADS